MQATNSPTQRNNTNGRTNIRPVALPTEHGGWGFITEPILLGLLIMPALPQPAFSGVFLGIAAFAAFLLRQPLKLWLKDTLKQRRVPRTALALRFMLIYGGVALVAFMLTLITAPNFDFLIPLALSVPVFLIQLIYDARNQSRSTIAELAGASATGAIASGIVMLGGASLTVALLLWLALALKGITAVMYVRARLRLEREKPAPIGVAWALHALSLATLAGVYLADLLPITAPFAMAILTFRAVLGLSPWRKTRQVKTIGFMELGFGLTYVALLVIGFWL